jgi:hypothetical protein
VQVDWLTPVEVFAPWYGRALAHYMLELRKHESRGDSSTPLTIVEIGGGTGTLAASILVRPALLLLLLLSHSRNLSPRYETYVQKQHAFDGTRLGSCIGPSSKGPPACIMRGKSHADLQGHKLWLTQCVVLCRTMSLKWTPLCTAA